MQESATIAIDPERPSRWSVIAPVVASALVLWISYVAEFIFPGLWKWQITGFVSIALMGTAAGWIAPRGRQWLTFGVLALGLGLLTLIVGSGWFYYSLWFVPVVLAVRWGVLAAGYVGGLFLRRFRVGRWTMFAVLGCIVLTEVGWILARDGYLLIRYATPTRWIASNDTNPNWLLLAPGQRAAGLTHVALQRKATDTAAAKRVFKKALYAASQIPKDNHAVLFGIAQGQVQAGFFADAEATILLIEDPIQWDLHYALIAVEMTKHGGRSHAQRLFQQAIRAAQQDPDQARRDRDLYLIGYRQWEGGMFNEARQTAELIQTADSKADLLNRLSDSAQLELARQQAGARHFREAEATIKRSVKDPYRYCDALISIATAAATNAQPADARRIFNHALKSAQQLESPMGSNGVMADIALRQLELGFQTESQQTLALITNVGVKAELVKKLARVKPIASNL